MKKILLLILTLPLWTSCRNQTPNVQMNYQDSVTVDSLKMMVWSLPFKHKDIVIAQAILETGWFKSKNYQVNNNLFGMKVINVESTLDLQSALAAEFKSCDVLIMAAAVSDARPVATEGKVKKANYKNLNLVENPDLLAEISKVKTTQLLVGFAAEESANLLQEGKRKMESKNLDIIYANDIADGTIFGSDMTSGFLIDRNGEVEIKATSKKTLSTRLLNMVSERLNSPNV